MAKQKDTKKKAAAARKKKENDMENWQQEYAEPGTVEGSYDQPDRGDRQLAPEARAERGGGQGAEMRPNITGDRSNAYRDREPSERALKRSRSAHFEKYAAEGNRFIHEVADELGTDDHSMALRITKAVLHAVRDRIPPSDAVKFGQGFPTMLKAIYFEEYDISKTPVLIRRRDEFVDFIRFKNRFAAIHDFPTPDFVVIGLRGVFRVLERWMDPGQINHVKRILNSDLCDLIDGGKYGAGRPMY